MEIEIENHVLAEWVALCESGWEDPDVRKISNKLSAADLAPYFSPWTMRGWFRPRRRPAELAWELGSRAMFDAPDGVPVKIRSEQLHAWLGTDGRSTAKARNMAKQERARFAVRPGDLERVISVLPADRSVTEIDVTLDCEHKAWFTKRAWRVVPGQIGDYAQLETLILRGHLFETLPPEIGRLKRLRRLSIQSTRFASLPPELGDLDALEHLTIEYPMFLAEIPKDIGRLHNLRQLWLTGCYRLATLPDELALTPLECIELSTEPPYPVTDKLHAWFPNAKINIKGLPVVAELRVITD
jgi:hypothetical protein